VKAFSYALPGGETATYVDRKRHLWLLSVIFPLLPPLCALPYLAGSGTWVLWIPMLVLYGAVPILDRLLGQDESNPPEILVPELESDPYYRVLTYLAVPLHFLTLLGGAWLAATQPLPWHALLALSLSVGLVSGLAINTAHELGHKNTALEQALAALVLAPAAYGHFTIEHNAGHHSEVATPEDSASARMGESIYRFALREIPGGIRRAWRLESRRLDKQGQQPWSTGNRILRNYALSGVLFGGLLSAFGPAILPFLVVQTAFAWWQLTSANYIEHYGLLREKKANGRYERCQPRHSWNANHIFSNLILFHLERHSDHHANAGRRYQSLRHFDNLPQLPSGYFGMFLAAYIPPLWRRIMDHRVVALAGGDMNRVNVDPRVRDRLFRRYHRAGALTA